MTCRLDAMAVNVTAPPSTTAVFSVMPVCVISTLGSTGKLKPLPLPAPAVSEAVRLIVPTVYWLPESTWAYRFALAASPEVLPSVMLMPVKEMLPEFPTEGSLAGFPGVAAKSPVEMVAGPDWVFRAIVSALTETLPPWV